MGSEVQVLPGPFSRRSLRDAEWAEREEDLDHPYGGVAQLGEHLLCKQGVIGSIPIVSIFSPALPRAEWAEKEDGRSIGMRHGR